MRNGDEVHAVVVRMQQHLYEFAASVSAHPGGQSVRNVGYTCRVICRAWSGLKVGSPHMPGPGWISVSMTNPVHKEHGHHTYLL